MSIKLCKCGCGQEPNYGDWVKSHWNIGREHSKETKRKMSESQKESYKNGTRNSWNKGLNKETDERIKGHIPWNKGKKGLRKPSEETRMKMSKAHKGKLLSEEAKRKIGEFHKGRIRSGETRKKISESKKGSIPWNKGRIEVYSKETLRKMSKAKKGRVLSEERKRKMSITQMGKNNNFYGKRHSIETRQKIAKANKGNTWKKLFGTEGAKQRKLEKSKLWKGKNNPSWLGGISFEPYGLMFNDELKYSIRLRDNFVCQLCGKNEDTLKEKLSTHHIDYCKTNNDQSNLILLCRSCHIKTNFNRDYWTSFFQKEAIMKKILMVAI